MILANGKIWTENPQQKEAQAVALGGNQIIAVGSTSEIMRLKQSGTEVVDLGGPARGPRVQ